MREKKKKKIIKFYLSELSFSAHFTSGKEKKITTKGPAPMTSGRRETRENGNSGPTHTHSSWTFLFPSLASFFLKLAYSSYTYTYTLAPYVTSSLWHANQLLLARPPLLTISSYYYDTSQPFFFWEVSLPVHEVRKKNELQQTLGTSFRYAKKHLASNRPRDRQLSKI